MAEVVEFTCVSVLIQSPLLITSTRPPTDCGTPGSWAAITLNFTVTSNGTQFDRLGIFTFQNVESTDCIAGQQPKLTLYSLAHLYSGAHL